MSEWCEVLIKITTAAHCSTGGREGQGTGYSLQFTCPTAPLVQLSDQLSSLSFSHVRGHPLKHPLTRSRLVNPSQLHSAVVAAMKTVLVISMNIQARADGKTSFLKERSEYE